MSIVTDWKKKLEYEEDPFREETPEEIEEVFVDREEEREKLNMFLLKEENYGTVVGEQGVGKHALMKWFDKNIEKEFKTIIIENNGDQERTENLGKKDFVKRVLEKHLNFFEKTITKPHEKLSFEEMVEFIKRRSEKKRTIILLYGELPEETLSLLNDLVSESRFALVIFCEPSEKEQEKFENLEDYLEIELDPLSKESMKKMLAKRIENAGRKNCYPFSEEDVEELVEQNEEDLPGFLRSAKEKAMSLSLRIDELEEKEKTDENKEEGGDKGKKSAEEDKEYDVERGFLKKLSSLLSIEVISEEEFKERNKSGSERGESKSRVEEDDVLTPPSPAIGGADDKPSGSEDGGEEQKSRGEGEEVSEEVERDAEMLRRVIEEAEEKKKVAEGKEEKSED